VFCAEECVVGSSRCVLLVQIVSFSFKQCTVVMSTNIALIGLTRNVTEDHLREILSKWGKIGSVKMIVETNEKKQKTKKKVP
jgi:RNA recognition motif-containing protein